MKSAGVDFIKIGMLHVIDVSCYCHCIITALLFVVLLSAAAFLAEVTMREHSPELLPSLMHAFVDQMRGW